MTGESGLAPVEVLNVADIKVGYGSRIVIDGLNIVVYESERWACIGCNGSGKSTVIKAFAGILKPLSGKINIKGANQDDLTYKERARLISYVPQSQRSALPFSVYDYTMLSRYPYHGYFPVSRKQDHEAVCNALALTDCDTLSDRRISTLSGGEAQRVFLAGAVAQKAALILLDEPTSHLDPLHENHFYRVLLHIDRKERATIIAATHSVNSALQYYTHVLALRDGKPFFSGKVSDFRENAADLLGDIYGIPFKKILDQETGSLYFVVR